ncbi:TPA: hypothetical protein ACMDRZ_003049 [Vibrio cholerae]|uniref:hypothetical protein n=1 Tax=Vibrio cholerae TaxID=666 RepID=UPI00158420B0|nr:hypothetical protein [Vibrio cholerae]QKU65649.1 hypothetical protein HPY17_20235 [Vibrio cholerae]QKU69453.1 hypothetical protein HPY10_19885 [Vibrio cholerae]
MKVVNKLDGSVIGVFPAEIAKEEIRSLGINPEDCDFIKNQAELDRENLLYLASTDWLVTRHRDQVDMEVNTSMTDVEYKELLLKRQEAREAVVDQDALNKWRETFGKNQIA